MVLLFSSVRVSRERRNADTSEAKDVFLASLPLPSFFFLALLARRLCALSLFSLCVSSLGTSERSRHNVEATSFLPLRFFFFS